jgi:hypothetical protein
MSSLLSAHFRADLNLYSERAEELPISLPGWEGKGMKAVPSIVLALFVCAAPAFADVTVNSPSQHSKLVSPFWLSAAATPCSSQAIEAMGYSLDDSSNTTIVQGNRLNTTISFPIGSHLLHVKSWGNQGASCVTTVSVTVVPPPTSTVPSDAIKVSGIQTYGDWEAARDTATGRGWSSGTMGIVNSPALTGYAREFESAFSNYSGERYDVPFGSDTESHNFLYDAWLYLANPSSNIASLEMDVNQVMANGQTVIFGFQCDGYSGTWDFTLNAGSPWNSNDQWRHSYSWCNPREWSTNTWHHIQISYSRDDRGNVTYKSLWFDNLEQDIYVTVPSAFALGWDPTLLTNFQVDGLGTSGSSKVYLDNLTIYRW